MSEVEKQLYNQADVVEVRPCTPDCLRDQNGVEVECAEE